MRGRAACLLQARLERAMIFFFYELRKEVTVRDGKRACRVMLFTFILHAMSHLRVYARHAARFIRCHCCLRAAAAAIKPR